MAAAVGTSEAQGLGMEEFHGCTLLHLACETADIWMIELLLQYGAVVLSGNRNFEGRVHPLTRANYLASPPLVVAYALVITVCVKLLFYPQRNTQHKFISCFACCVF
uniref:Aconitase/3-isopropylmalate dehydratase large subunit alpha/beta/alpha domain-containing protein n=1 Tax=Lactuca sativa TaxID=4236 RepID=A0A9R1W1B3_LACSA|nr:hypothetical protein LSAT_V11C400199760 [Lactuca sativa]